MDKIDYRKQFKNGKAYDRLTQSKHVSLIYELEKKVLLIDLDPQGNASQGLGFTTKIDPDIYSALCWTQDKISKGQIESVIKKTDLKYLDIIANYPDLYNAANIVYITGPENNKKIKEKHNEIVNKWRS